MRVDDEVHSELTLDLSESALWRVENGDQRRLKRRQSCVQISNPPVRPSLPQELPRPRAVPSISLAALCLDFGEVVADDAVAAEKIGRLVPIS